MKLNRIRLENYRNIESADCEFSEGVNLICGDNAQGKTNLLEAVYIFARGRAFRAKKEEQVITFGKENTFCKIEYSDRKRVCDMSVRYVKGAGKKLTYNGIDIKKTSEFIGKFRAVLFSPDSLSLIKSSPSERRLFTDIAISQLKPDYVKNLKRYNTLLSQRNAVLREQAEPDPEIIHALALQMSEICAQISRERYIYLEKINLHVGEILKKMSGEKEKTKLIYTSEGFDSGKDSFTDIKSTEDKYYRLFTENTERERTYKTSLYGIQRDDFDVYLNGKSAKLYCSQGQTRSIALAMKLAEGKISLESEMNGPVYLLDDVFGELDENRRNFILNELDGSQVIITSCQEHEIKGINKFYMKNGTVKHTAE